MSLGFGMQDLCLTSTMIYFGAFRETCRNRCVPFHLHLSLCHRASSTLALAVHDLNKLTCCRECVDHCRSNIVTPSTSKHSDSKHRACLEYSIRSWIPMVLLSSFYVHFMFILCSFFPCFFMPTFFASTFSCPPVFCALYHGLDICHHALHLFFLLVATKAIPVARSTFCRTS